MLFLTQIDVMASRRKFKKQIKEKTNLLIEDAFIEAINGDEKESNKMEGIIDNIIDDRHDMLSKVCNYPNNEKRAAIKDHFNSIKDTLASKTSDYKKKVGIVG